jgi:pSer/pThr/pTyr-binding forkhead associated (FHA) protein
MGQSMPARLIALSGTAEIVLSGILTVAGRHASCDTQLPSSRVSRRHCCLGLGDGEVLVRDLGSHNGTWINGQRVAEGILRPGDVLGIAHLQFRLILQARAEGADPENLARCHQIEPARLSGGSVGETARTMKGDDIKLE